MSWTFLTNLDTQATQRHKVTFDTVSTSLPDSGTYAIITITRTLQSMVETVETQEGTFTLFQETKTTTIL